MRKRVLEAMINDAVERFAVPPIERRDPLVATTTLDYRGVGQSQVPEWDAEAAIRNAYLVNTYVYRGVEVIAKAIAGSPFRAGSDLDKRVDWRPNAPLARFLGPPPGGPNPNISSRRLWAWTVAQRLITGRWCWETELAGSNIVGLWPIPSSTIKPIPTTKGREYFSGYEHTALSSARRRILTPNQVMYDWIPSQTDIREPESPLQGARYDISILVSQDRYDYAFLRNDARPATVIVHEQFAERDEREAFRQQFLMEHRGPDNAGKPIFVEASPGDEEINRTFHIEQLGLSQKDAMFIPRMEAKIRAVCVALGTPLSILGDASGRTFNNAGQEYRNWWEGTLLPLMDDLSDAVNMRLAPRLGPEVGWFDTSHVAALKAENKIYALGAAAATFIENKIFTINEVREAYNLKPFTDAELAEIEKPKEMMRQETKTTEPNDDESRDTDRRSALPDLPVTILSETDNILVLQKGA